jgi:hypothetical protein
MYQDGHVTAPLQRLITTRPEHDDHIAPAQPSGALRCQWCNTALPAGATLCPSCGSAGVADPRLTSVAELPVGLVEAVPDLATRADASELVEWWRDNDDPADDAILAPKLSLEELEARRVRTFAAIGVAVVVCVGLGWLAGPLLAPGMERLTGTTVEHPSDLRGAGTFLGALVGMFVGAIGGWIIWSSN